MRIDGEIADLSPDDAAALAALLGAQRAEYVGPFHPFAFDEATIAAQLRARIRDRYWSLRRAGELAGFFMMRGLDRGFERPAFGIFVAEQHSGFGLARLALRHALDWAAAERIGAVILTVAVENTRALQIYEDFGFRPTGQLADGGQRIYERALNALPEQTNFKNQPMKRIWDIQRIETDQIPALEQKMYEKVSDAATTVDFYEKRQDMIIKRDPQTFEKTNRIWQFEYLWQARAHAAKHVPRLRLRTGSRRRVFHRVSRRRKMGRRGHLERIDPCREGPLQAQEAPGKEARTHLHPARRSQAAQESYLRCGHRAVGLHAPAAGRDHRHPPTPSRSSPSWLEVFLQLLVLPEGDRAAETPQLVLRPRVHPHGGGRRESRGRDPSRLGAPYQHNMPDFAKSTMAVFSLDA